MNLKNICTECPPSSVIGTVWNGSIEKTPVSPDRKDSSLPSTYRPVGEGPTVAVSQALDLAGPGAERDRRPRCSASTSCTEFAVGATPGESVIPKEVSGPSPAPARPNPAPLTLHRVEKLLLSKLSLYRAFLARVGAQGLGAGRAEVDRGRRHSRRSRRGRRPGRSPPRRRCCRSPPERPARRRSSAGSRRDSGGLSGPLRRRRCRRRRCRPRSRREFCGWAAIALTSVWVNVLPPSDMFAARAPIAPA